MLISGRTADGAKNASHCDGGCSFSNAAPISWVGAVRRRERTWGRDPLVGGNGYVRQSPVSSCRVLWVRVPEAVAHGARTRAITDLEALICTLHEAGLYVIARMAVFKDT